MSNPIRTCVVCSEDFELRPGKPGFANRCPACSEADGEDSAGDAMLDVTGNKSEVNAARRRAMYDLLYRKES